MTEKLLQEQTLEFAVKIVGLCKNHIIPSDLSSQLLRSGTSIGANVREAFYGQSPADFVSKLRISLKECYETEYWLELFVLSNLITEEVFQPLHKESGKIRSRLISSIQTTLNRYPELK